MAIGVGLYGANGHQVYGQAEACPDTEVVAIAAIPEKNLNERQRANPALRRYQTLDELIADERVQLISLCSPRRADQAADALRCLKAGKHVYAEKPCALTEADLDALIAQDAAGPARFHEMAGTAFAQPWLAMGEIVRNGQLGTVIQVFAQKSYPFFDGRPQDEAVDGGLTCQAGVHAYRFIEHVTGLRITEVQAMETQLGNPVVGGGLRRASTSIMRLENGALATVIANYCNPRGFPSWGNETLRIFGTEGFVEAVDGGSRTRLVVGTTDHGPIDTSAPGRDYLLHIVDELLGRRPMPLSLEDELHPTRMVIRARDAAR